MAKVAAQESFVVFPLIESRFALPTADVVELIKTGSLHLFPHTTPGLVGVLIRHGRILPVWDIASAILGEDEPTLKYCLVTRRNFVAEELTAIPVSGECQLLSTVMEPAPVGAPAYVRGVVRLAGQPVDVLDLQQLCPLPNPAVSAAGLAQVGKERP
jgi:chemotaxis signal transduction protein